MAFFIVIVKASFKSYAETPKQPSLGVLRLPFFLIETPILLYTHGYQSLGCGGRSDIKAARLTGKVTKNSFITEATSGTASIRSAHSFTYLS